jgi:hypothetical protein
MTEEQSKKLIKIVLELIQEHNKLEAKVAELEERVEQLGAVIPYDAEEVGA